MSLFSENNKMRMMLVGAGAVGESILKILTWRDPEGEFLEYVLITDYDAARAAEVKAMLEDAEQQGRQRKAGTKEPAADGTGSREISPRFASCHVNATDTAEMVALIRAHNINFVMDAAPPFASNMIFNAAWEGNAHYGNMGTWSVPMEHPAYGLGIENSYTEPMTKYNFDRHEQWREKGLMALICLGIDPGVVNVYAKYAALHLFDHLYETHVKDGGNLTIPGADPDDITFGFNVWTVMDEVMNPNVEYDVDKGGHFVEPAFAGQETFLMPDGVGLNTLVKVEHEETVTMPRYLSQYGLKRASFKIALDENLIQALKVLDKLGLRSLKPVEVDGCKIVPRDVVAACAPQPKDIGAEMEGEMLVGVHCIGEKDGEAKEYFLYQPFDNTSSVERWGCQAVTMQTGWGAALAIELMARGIWNEPGVYSPEYFEPDPYIGLMKETGYRFEIQEIR